MQSGISNRKLHFFACKRSMSDRELLGQQTWHSCLLLYSTEQPSYSEITSRVHKKLKVGVNLMRHGVLAYVF